MRLHCDNDRINLVLKTKMHLMDENRRGSSKREH
jgi:hypothetical protein